MDSNNPIKSEENNQNPPNSPTEPVSPAGTIPPPATPPDPFTTPASDLNPPVQNPSDPTPQQWGPTIQPQLSWQPPSAPPPDLAAQPQPTYESTPPTFDTTYPSSPQPQPEPAQTQPTEGFPSTPGEAAPTDLSHLISQDNSQMPESQTPPVATSETLVSPTSVVPEVPTIPTTETGGRGIPKWVIGLGVGLLIVVAGASAYFILGIGQPPKTSSIPATQTPAAQTVSSPIPAVQPSPAAVATGSASFGELEGSGSQQATSAADLLRQRQGR